LQKEQENDEELVDELLLNLDKISFPNEQ